VAHATKRQLFCLVQNLAESIVELKDGKVTGGDPVFAYSGSYVQTGDEFSASLTTRRHTRRGNHPCSISTT
jgi:hypothetical protein